MNREPTRAVLWANVVSLMKARYGKENLTRLAKEANIGPGTASRIKAQETSVGMDVVDAIAGVFKLESWQLLTPDLDPKSPPELATNMWPFPSVSLPAVRSLPGEKRAQIEGFMLGKIDNEPDQGVKRSAA